MFVLLTYLLTYLLPRNLIVLLHYLVQVNATVRI